MLIDAFVVLFHLKLELMLCIRSSWLKYGAKIHNFKPSCDFIFGTVEDTYAITIMKLCGMYNFFGKKNSITVNLNIYASHLSKQK